MATIGVLFGMENVFPGALVERINAMGVAGVTPSSCRSAA